MWKKEQLDCDTLQNPIQSLDLLHYDILRILHGTRTKLSRQFKSPGEIKTPFLIFQSTVTLHSFVCLPHYE